MQEIKESFEKIKQELKEMIKIKKELKRIKQRYSAFCKIQKIVNRYDLKMTRAESTSGERWINIYGIIEEVSDESKT